VVLAAEARNREDAPMVCLGGVRDVGLDHAVGEPAARCHADFGATSSHQREDFSFRGVRDSSVRVIRVTQDEWVVIDRDTGIDPLDQGAVQAWLKAEHG
jgi:hypothetical protein